MFDERRMMGERADMDGYPLFLLRKAFRTMGIVI